MSMEQATTAPAADRGHPFRAAARLQGAGGAAGAALRPRPARLPDPAPASLRRHLHGPLPLLRPPRLRRPRPSWSKRSSPARPTSFHAGEANATVLEPALGPNSVLTLDDAPHMQQRKLLLPPFHGERIARLRRADARGDPAGDGDLAGRRALRPASPHPADHPGGDHARGLRRPRRASASAASAG